MSSPPADLTPNKVITTMHVASRSSITAALAVHTTNLATRSPRSLGTSLRAFVTSAMRTVRGTKLDAVPMADAGLVRLCATFQDAHARCEAAPDDGMEWKVWLDRRWEICSAIEGMVSSTEAGRRAKAQVALILMEEPADITNEYKKFALVTLRDLAGSAAA